MRERATRELRGRSRAAAPAFRASLVVVSGKGEGCELELVSESAVVGRGPGADLVLDDAAISRRHAVFERGAKGYCVRDLGSTNGVRVNGTPTAAADLEHGDRIELGEHVLQYLVEACEAAPRTYHVEG